MWSKALCFQKQVAMGYLLLDSKACHPQSSVLSVGPSWHDGFEDSAAVLQIPSMEQPFARGTVAWTCRHVGCVANRLSIHKCQVRLLRQSCAAVCHAAIEKQKRAVNRGALLQNESSAAVTYPSHKRYMFSTCQDTDLPGAA